MLFYWPRFICMLCTASLNKYVYMYCLFLWKTSIYNRFKCLHTQHMLYFACTLFWAMVTTSISAILFASYTIGTKHWIIAFYMYKTLPKLWINLWPSSKMCKYFKAGFLLQNYFTGVKTRQQKPHLPSFVRSAQNLDLRKVFFRNMYLKNTQIFILKWQVEKGLCALITQLKPIRPRHFDFNCNWLLILIPNYVHSLTAILNLLFIWWVFCSVKMQETLSIYNYIIDKFDHQ